MRCTVQLEAAISRIALVDGSQQTEAVDVSSLSVQPGRKEGQLEVTVQLAGPLQCNSSRVSVVFDGFGLPGWDQRKTKSVNRDRCTLKFDASASQQQQLSELGDELAAGTKQATAAVSGAASSSTACEEGGSSAARAEAMLLELRPQAAAVIQPASLTLEAAAAVRQALWSRLREWGAALVLRDEECQLKQCELGSTVIDCDSRKPPSFQ